MRDLGRLEPWLTSQERANRRRAARARPIALAGPRGPVSVALVTAALAGPAAAVASGHVITAASERRPAGLARGATGPAVRAVQVALGIPADGIFGPQTERALRRLQRARGLGRLESPILRRSAPSGWARSGRSGRAVRPRRSHRR